MRRSFSGEIDREIAISDHKRESASQQRREMEAPPPDTRVQSETLEEVAERILRELFVIAPGIALSSLHPTYQEDYNTILSALRNERERAAKVADAVENKWIEDARNVARADDLVGSLAQSTYNNYAEIAHNIAQAIREGR